LLFGTATLVTAQQQRPPTPPQRPPAAQPAAPAAAPAAAPTVPQRTETITYDAWTVTCRDPVTAGAKKACSAVLQLRVVQQNRQQVLGAWVLGKNNDGVLMSVLQTPQIQAGVLIQKGVDFKLGNAAPRKLSYVACTAQRCETSVQMDAAMVKDALAAANATITIYAANGRDVTLNIPSIKGVDKAIAAIGR
jgi:invasion protein IalB